ncbi:MAG: AAA family ATPase, partial [Clostridia bacterium]|nr:AAA family ATPase [Clostridia bacterium]
MKGKIIIICGATGSGKSNIAIEVAKKLNGEIISADSLAIYKGLDIGTAKPTISQQKEVKHHLIDVVSPFDDFSVSEYEKMSL